MVVADDRHSFDPEMRVGSVVGAGYQLEAVLGVGSTATVYAARHATGPNSGHRCAIKMLHPSIARSLSMRKSFLREGCSANRVDHPGTVMVSDDDITKDGAPFLVMELLEGQTLAWWLERAPRMSPRIALLIALRVLDLLGAAHHTGVLHRDIRPENIFITNDGEVRLLDFGMARFRRELGFPLLGVPGYMAPEQAQGRRDRCGTWTDIFSVGAVLHRILTGHQIFEGTTEYIVERTATRAIPLLVDRFVDLDRKLARIVDGALIFDPASRWWSASAFRDAIIDHYLQAWGTVPARIPMDELGSMKNAEPLRSVRTQLGATNFDGSATMAARLRVGWQRARAASTVHSRWSSTAVALVFFMASLTGGTAIYKAYGHAQPEIQLSDLEPAAAPVAAPPPAASTPVLTPTLILPPPSAGVAPRAPSKRVAKAKGETAAAAAAPSAAAPAPEIPETPDDTTELLGAALTIR